MTDDISDEPLDAILTRGDRIQDAISTIKVNGVWKMKETLYPQYHEELIANYTEMIPKVAAAGYTNLICFSGNRLGMDDQIGLQNCVNGLKNIIC